MVESSSGVEARRRTWIVDSIDEGLAAVEEDGGRIVHLPLWVLPDGVHEGDVLRVWRENTLPEGSATLRIETDRDATTTARRRAQEQLDRLAARDPGGDIAL